MSALGVGYGAAVGETLARALPAIGPVRAFPTDGCSSQLGGEVGDVATHLQDGEARRLSRASQLAVVAARLALSDARLQPGQLAAMGLVLGSHWGDFRSSETFALGFLERGVLGLSPLVFPSTVMNAMAAHVSIAVGVRGPMLTLNEVDVAGELAVARGAALIASGRASIVLAGGADELSPILYGELSRLGTMSRTAPGPEGCRPFDRRANGTVLGEGATFLVLESAESALARGVHVYGELAGAAWGNLPTPAHGFPSPRRRDPQTVRRALASAGVTPEAVEAAYLTGSGHPEHDACELDLVARALGERAGPPDRADPAGRRARGSRRAARGRRRARRGGRRGAGAPRPLEAGPPRSSVRGASREPAGGPPETALVHGLARGGTHVALVLRAPGRDRKAAA